MRKNTASHRKKIEIHQQSPNKALNPTDYIFFPHFGYGAAELGVQAEKLGLAVGLSVKFSMHIFFFPYFGGNAHSWHQVIALLPEFDCTAFSLANVGEKAGVYRVENAIEELETLCLSTATGPFLLIGHSMGGKFALGIAAKGADDLKGVLLVAPSPPSPEPIPDAVRERMLSTHGTREAALTTISGASVREIGGEALENAVRANLETSETDWKNWLERGSYDDISSVLPDVKIPVAVIIGDGDTGMTRELMESEIVSKISGSRLEIISNAGHLLPLEAPDELAALIREFAAAIEKAA